MKKCYVSVNLILCQQLRYGQVLTLLSCLHTYPLGRRAHMVSHVYPLAPILTSCVKSRVHYACVILSPNTRLLITSRNSHWILFSTQQCTANSHKNMVSGKNHDCDSLLCCQRIFWLDKNHDYNGGSRSSVSQAINLHHRHLHSSCKASIDGCLINSLVRKLVAHKRSAQERKRERH